MLSQPQRRCTACNRALPASAKFCPYDGGALEELPARPARTEILLDRRYRLVELIGRGGMGTVYRAFHLDLNRSVAVKVLNGELTADRIAIERFRREARALARVTHPNAVAVTDFGVTPEGIAYIVMELLDGRNLRGVLEAERPLAPVRAAKIIKQVAAAVTAAHECGIIHRDLKPDNVVLLGSEFSETAKVLDFGIAKLMATGGLTGKLTERDAVMGTPQYMSPEACQAHPLTPATDIYSLGIMAYELLTGYPPFDAETSLETALMHVNEQPPRLTGIRPDVTADMESVIFRALSKDPQFRQQSATDFGEQLDAAVRAGRQILSRRTTPMERPNFNPDHHVTPQVQPVPAVAPSRPLLSPLAVIGLALVGAVLGLLVAIALIYFFVPPPTRGPSTTIVSPATSARPSAEGEPATVRLPREYPS